MDKLQVIDGMLSTVQTEIVEALLAVLYEETVSGMVGPYTVPLGSEPTAKPPGNKRCEFTPTSTAFTFNQATNSWDLCDDGEGEKSPKQKKKDETGTLGFIARRGMLPSPERAV